MKVSKNQIFNLMDTNGRRNDVINAIQCYISILEEVTIKKRSIWGNVPISLAQFQFYQKVIENSPNVFRQHEPYDELMKKIEQYPQFKEALLLDDLDYILNHLNDYKDILEMFDKGIEDRARHYTSNLVKLGFVDKNRNISKVGELLLNLKKLKKDKIESLMSIDNVNIIYLRQLLKLRIFDTNKENYYSPFNMAIYILLKKDRISEETFFEIIQGLNPYTKINNIDEYINNYENGDIINNIEIHIPKEMKLNILMDKELFKNNFKNKKSQKQIEIYWKYYNLLYEFNSKRNSDILDKLLTFWENEKEVLNKAFGVGKNIFNNRKGTRPNPEEFVKKHENIFSDNLNEYLYKAFIKSKQIDSIFEYSDTTKRIFKATGIISFNNGYVELAYKELLKYVFKKEYFQNKIFGNILNELSVHYEVYEEYEEGIDSYFCTVKSISEILELYDKDITNIIEEIQIEFGGVNIIKIPQIIADKRKTEFNMYIEKIYPKEKVKHLLELFRNRNNDKIIKDIVSKDATVPTIYEYIVGIAWYYFSGKKINLLESYNLTLSANFEPIVHAGRRTR